MTLQESCGFGFGPLGPPNRTQTALRWQAERAQAHQTLLPLVQNPQFVRPDGASGGEEAPRGGHSTGL